MLRKALVSAVVVLASGFALAEEPPIKIGIIGPFTGKSSTDMGESIRGGARVFAEEVNALGGVLGRKILLVERDDKAIPDVGTQVAKDLIENENVVAAVGFANIGVATPAAKLFQSAKIPLIVSAAAGAEITRQDLPAGTLNHIFRVAGRDSLQTKAMFNDLVDRRKISEIAILHDDTPYGLAGKANALKELEARKIKPVVVESFKIGDQDMSAQLAKARDAGAKAIALYGLATEDAMAVRSAAKLGLKLPIVGTWTMSQQTFFQLAGPAAEGARTAVTFIEDDSRGPHRDFPAAYKRINKVERIPSAVAAAQTYDALRLIYLALFQSTKATPEAVQAGLENMKYSARSTVVTRYDRPFSRDDHEAISANMVIMGEVRNGKLVYAYPEDANAALIVRTKTGP